MQVLPSAQSPGVLQQFGIAVFEHSPVEMLQASAVHALPSAQSWLLEQHPGTGE